ncbi:MAG TPA: tyrosine-protein phosphatase [Acidimicrobiales bacterium]|nr:tyrosine-protein phosphatase [Acidimicrobiales bacterium]
MGTAISLIEDVEVTRLDDGRLAVSWKVAGECDQVDLAWGRSADGLDHVHVETVPAAAGHAEVDPGPAGARGRVFVSVAPAGHPATGATNNHATDAGATNAATKAGAGPGATVAGERRIGMNGPVNFRDLGGYRGAGGATVRWGRVFRSDALLLDDRDMEDFAGLGIRTVYDLRSDMERSAVPNRLPEGDAPAVVVLPLISEDSSTNPLADIDSADGEDFLAHLYLHILERSAVNFGRVLTGLSREEELPAVFHCAAGKDRTGMVAAVLLSVLGVPLEDILDDYELTGRYRTTEHVQASMQRLGEAQQLAPEIVAGMLRAPRWAMQSALSQVAQRYGDFDGYLTGPAQVAAEVPDRLRDLLLRA